VRGPTARLDQDSHCDLTLWGRLGWEVLWEHILELFQQQFQLWEALGSRDLLKGVGR
jgi:hypothetical protein